MKEIHFLVVTLVALVTLQATWADARSAATETPAPKQLVPGDPAPDFTLRTHDRKYETRLSNFRGKKPVVLVFGSYT
jgi:hypothetical protein